MVRMGPVSTPGSGPSQRVATEVAAVGRAPAPTMAAGTEVTVFEESLEAWQRAALPTS